MAKAEAGVRDLFTAGLRHMGLRYRKLAQGDGWPDWEVYLPGGTVAFVELKAEDWKPGRRKGEKLQRHMQNELRKLGFPVLQTTNAQDALNWINRL